MLNLFFINKKGYNNIILYKLKKLPLSPHSNSLRLHPPKPRDRAPDRDRARRVENVRPARDRLAARRALPDAGRLALDSGFAAEAAVVSGWEKEVEERGTGRG